MAEASKEASKIASEEASKIASEEASKIASEPESEEIALPAKVDVKNISNIPLHLTYGEIKPGESGHCSKAEFENFAGSHLEKS